MYGSADALKLKSADTGSHGSEDYLRKAKPLSKHRFPEQLMNATASFPMRQERKVITALFADLVGSTTLGEQFDPEDLREIINPAIALMIARVEEFGGIVKDLAGDGMLALFGAQTAHEDDPERAIRAGLAIAEDVRRYAIEVEHEWNAAGFGVRIGVETDLAVLGPVGSGSRVEYGAVGDVVNVAARLQSHADPFEVLVGLGTHRQVEGLFEWSDPRSLQLKGKREEVSAQVALRPRTKPGTQRGFAGTRFPLVGRDQELSVLRNAVADLRRGQGSAVFLIGDPGVGKSRLVAETRDLLRGGEAAWIEGKSVSYGEGIPYWPFRDLLRSWLGAKVLDSAASLADSLGRQADLIFSSDHAEVSTYLGSVLGAALTDRARVELEILPPETRQFRTAEAFERWLSAISAHGPLVVVLEDLQWADGISLQLIERLIQRAVHHQVMLVLTHRREMDHPSFELHRRSAQSNVAVLNLTALPEGDEKALLEGLVGAGVLPDSVAERITAAAEGNPLYIEEMVRSLIDGGVLTKAGPSWRFDGDQPLEIPRTVERVIIARLDRLDQRVRSTVQTASVLGRQFGRDLLQLVVEDTQGLEQALERLITLDFFHHEGGDVYRFKHALIQEAAYNNMLKRDRQEFHRRTAAALLTLIADNHEPFYAVLAHHYRAGRQLVEAMRYYELAGAGARRVYAVAAALENYSAALGLADQVSPEHAPGIRLELGRVRARAGQIAEARDDFQRVVVQARETGDVPLEIDAMNELGFALSGSVNYREALPLLEQSLAAAKAQGLRQAEVAASARLSVVYTNLMRLDLAVEHARAAEAAATETEDDRALGMALDALQLASVLVGDMATVDDVSARLTAIHRRRGDLWYLQWALFQWAWVDMAAARWPEASRRFHEAADINQKIEDRGSASVFGAAATWIARVTGDYGRAIDMGRSALEQAQAVGHSEFVSWAAQNLGWAYLDALVLDQAVANFELSLRLGTEAGSRITMIRAASQLALARALTGDLAEAGEVADLAAEWIGEVRTPPGMVYLQGADGSVALAAVRRLQGRALEAVELLEPILAAAQRAGWFEIVAASQLGLGQAQAAIGNTQNAHARFAEAAAMAELHSMPGLEWRALAARVTTVSASAPRACEDDRIRAAEIVAALSSRLEDATIRAAFSTRAHTQFDLGGKP